MMVADGIIYPDPLFVKPQKKPIEAVEDCVSKILVSDRGK